MKTVLLNVLLTECNAWTAIALNAGPASFCFPFPMHSYDSIMLPVTRECMQAAGREVTGPTLLPAYVSQ